MLGCNESNIIFQQHLCKLGQLRRSNGRNSQVFGQRNLWPPHFHTFCELVEGEENKLTTFSTWTIMLGCNESNIIFQQHLCELGQLRRSNGRNSQVFGQRNLWPPHFRTFCELVEREENKLTTLSTWTIMLGCNESNIIFQQHLCKLGQLRRSNGRNSQVFGQRNLWPPHFHTFCELVEGEENKLTTFSTWTIMLGCNESNIIFQQHLCELGQLRRSNGRNSQVFGQRNLWPPHFRTFCELVEREENKLTTLSTWTIMLGCNESNIIFQQHLCKLGQLRRSNGRNSQVFGQRNLWPPHFHTFCELVEGEENILTTFSTWTIMLGCNESNIIFQQHLCELGQLRRSNGRNSQVFGQRNLWPPHFRTFCELVEREENKLTTLSTWTIMLGCNESNIIFQQHLCKLGQLRRSNGRNSQVFGQRNLWPPHFHTFCELVEGEENKLTTFSTWTIMLGCNESNIIFQQHLCKLGTPEKQW